MTMETIRADFDRLSAFDSVGWNHNNHYHPTLLRQVPESCTESLEIGCGTGTFTRLLGQRSGHVLGLDLSPEMVRIARERSVDLLNIEYSLVDVLEWTFPAERFDCIASIATLHHLPLEEMLKKMKNALKPGGVLLILDLFKASGLSDLLLSAAAFPASFFMRLGKTGLARSSRMERQAWDEHGKHDQYLKVPEVRRICRNTLPGATIRKHFFWRYSITWRKPVQARIEASR